jgi:hypothetical protein
MSLDTFITFGDGVQAQLLGNPIGSSFFLDEKFGTDIDPPHDSKGDSGVHSGVKVKKNEAEETVFHGEDGVSVMRHGADLLFFALQGGSVLRLSVTTFVA